MIGSFERSGSIIRENIRKRDICLKGMVVYPKNLSRLTSIEEVLVSEIKKGGLLPESQLFYSKDALVVYLTLIAPNSRFNLNDLDNWIGFKGDNSLEVANNFEFMSFSSPMENLPYHIRGWVNQVIERRSEEPVLDFF